MNSVSAGEWLCSCLNVRIVAIDFGAVAYLFEGENWGYWFWRGLRVKGGVS